MSLPMLIVVSPILKPAWTAEVAISPIVVAISRASLEMYSAQFRCEAKQSFAPQGVVPDGQLAQH